MQTPPPRAPGCSPGSLLQHCDTQIWWHTGLRHRSKKHKTKYTYIGFVCQMLCAERELWESEGAEIELKEKSRERAECLWQTDQHTNVSTLCAPYLYLRASVRSHQSSLQVISLSHPFLSPFPRHMPRVTSSWSNPGWWIPLATFATDLLSSIITTNKKMRDFAC